MLREWFIGIIAAVAGVIIALGGAWSALPASDAGGPDTPVSATPGAPETGTVTPRPGTPAPTPDVDYPIVEELAPIESVEMRVAESYPPQYFVQVVSGLPSGCASFARAEVTRVGNTFEITILNYMPAPDSHINCTAIYGMMDHSFRLDGGFRSGETYTVRVNDVTTTFTAQ